MRPNSVTSPEDFTKRLFPTRQKSFRLAEVNHQIALSLYSCDNPIHEIALAMLELAIDHIPLGFTNFLNDYLFGRLGRDTAKAFKFMRDFNSITQTAVRIRLPRVLKADLERVIRNIRRLNNLLLKEEGHATRFIIQTHTHVFSRAKAFTTSGQNG